MSRIADTPAAPRPARVVIRDVAAIVVLLAIALVSFGPVFSWSAGFLAGFGGILMGTIIAVLGWRLRWDLIVVTAVTMVTYFLFGGALALPTTTIAGVVPTGDTLYRLARLIVDVWRDLLTLNPPASSFVGPAVLPWLLLLVASVVSVSLALRMRRWAILAVAGPLVVFAMGILWGTATAPVARWQGLGFAILALVWGNRRRADVEGRIGGDDVVQSKLKFTLVPFLTRLGVIGIACALVAGLISALMPNTNRYLLRDHVVPPLQLQEYPSPLTMYRWLERDQKDTVLLTVTGLPAGQRVRLASMDSYDGVVYTVDANSASYMRVGDRIDPRDPSATQPASIEISYGDMETVWVPSAGETRAITFPGGRTSPKAEGLYLNRYTGTLLTTVGLGEGDSYRVDTAISQTVGDTELAKIGIDTTAQMPKVTNVPEVIDKRVADIVGTSTIPIEQLRKIEQFLKTEGYYSNGEGQKGSRFRPGHTAERIGTMLYNVDDIVGDDEQYAVAMALMANRIGIPARVVMGFHPDPGSTPGNVQKFTGAQARVWVEVPFQGVGMVTFDPTPAHDRVPKNDVPKPKPSPKPQVQPPPDPPKPVVKLPTDLNPDKRNRDNSQGNRWLQLALILGVSLVGLLLLLSPLLTILAMKARRRRARRNASTPDGKAGGAWAELVDAANDLGTKLDWRRTRQENADVLVEKYPEVPAREVAAAVDSATFGPTEATDAMLASLWESVEQTIRRMRSTVSRWGRLKASASLASLRASRAERKAATRAAKRSARRKARRR